MTGHVRVDQAGWFITVWLEIVFGSVILLSGVTQPLVLLVIASSLDGLAMFVYSVLLVGFSRGCAAARDRAGGGRLVAICWAVLFYGGFSVILLVDQFRQLVG